MDSEMTQKWHGVETGEWKNEGGVDMEDNKNAGGEDG